MSKTAQITIKRGVPGEAPCLQTYEVPYQDGMTVLDAIVWIRSNIDSSLAFRYSCINANACKECLVAVNGETVARMNCDDFTEPNKRPDGTPHKFNTALKNFPRKGYLGFQDHGHKVWYKNVKVLDLSKKK